MFRLTIKGFKSISELTLRDSLPFIALAGANGAGKSNIADALAFFGAVVKTGATQAIRSFGGFQQIHCYKLRKENRFCVTHAAQHPACPSARELAQWFEEHHAI